MWKRFFRIASFTFFLVAGAAVVLTAFNDYESEVSVLLPSFGIVATFDLFQLQSIFTVLGCCFLPLGIDREQPKPEPEIIQLNLN